MLPPNVDVTPASATHASNIRGGKRFALGVVILASAMVVFQIGFLVLSNVVDAAAPFVAPMSTND